VTYAPAAAAQPSLSASSRSAEADDCALAVAVPTAGAPAAQPSSSASALLDDDPPVAASAQRVLREAVRAIAVRPRQLDEDGAAVVARLVQVVHLVGRAESYRFVGELPFEAAAEVLNTAAHADGLGVRFVHAGGAAGHFGYAGCADRRQPPVPARG
jgi:hypothetical protein